jgi:hypothetical protein
MGYDICKQEEPSMKKIASMALFLVLTVMLSALLVAQTKTATPPKTTSPAAAAALSGTDILKQSDKKLLPENCIYTLSLNTKDDADGSETTYVFKGQKKGSTRNIMLVSQPNKVKGSSHMRREVVIWSYYTTDKQLKQQAYTSVFMDSLLSYGDVMSTELGYDYDVTKTEKSKNGKQYVLTLAPKPKHEGYAKILVYVNISDLVPQKREYYAKSGELMKSCDTVTLTQTAGKTVYLEQKYYEPLKNRYSVAVYDTIKYVEAAAISDSLFNENQLKLLAGGQ